MKIRIRNKWRKQGSRGSLKENAAAVAYAAWQIALAAAKNLHAEDFEYASDDQRISVIAEYLVFLFHIADRFSYMRLPETERAEFVTELAQQLARHYQRNVEDIAGPGDYHRGLVKMLNARSVEYAGTSFDGETPGYGTRRVLGRQIQELMGAGQTNKWITQQIIDVDSIDATKYFQDTILSVFGSSSVPIDATTKRVRLD